MTEHPDKTDALGDVCRLADRLTSHPATEGQPAMTEFYRSSSKGDVRIADMPHRHLVNSYNLLVDKADPDREAERAAMAAQIAVNEAKFAEEADAKAEAV